MLLSALNVKNYRSIVDSGDIRFERIQAFVGENNCGKSNLLYSIQVFLSGGAGGSFAEDFNDPTTPIVITATFSELTQTERRVLRPYLLGDKLILEKRIEIEGDTDSAKPRLKAEYHGYVATPKDWWLSVDTVIEHEERPRPNWRQVAEDHEILDYVQNDDGGVNKASYQAGVSRLLVERDDVEYEEPALGDTQALGYQSVLLNYLPALRLLPAITDYSDEIDRRSSSTNFRLLMGDLAERILVLDPRYAEIEDSLARIESLLNPSRDDDGAQEGYERLEIMEVVEGRLQELVSQLMPSVKGVKIHVDLEPPRDFFSRGVSILVDDGRLTAVMMKGHGLQRCVVFALIRALILNQRGQLIDIEAQAEETGEEESRTIILAIEEPELYIHPQMQRLIYSVLKEFAQTDQVVYTTHSPSFVDVGAYHTIGVLRKVDVNEGTKVFQCEAGVLDAETERKTFQFVSSFGIEQNNLFFARRVMLVEGDSDVIAILACARRIGLFNEYPEEIGFSLIPTRSKQEMPKYMKLLNAFGIPYVILHELDGDSESEENGDIRELLGDNDSVELPDTLEAAVGHEGHFAKTYNAMKFFEHPENIAEGFLEITAQLFQ